MAACCCISKCIFFAVMVIGRPARLNLIPQICLAPLTWDHLMRLCPTPDSRSVAFPLFLTPAAPPFSPECSRLLGSNPIPAVGNSFPFSTRCFFCVESKTIGSSCFPFMDIWRLLCRKKNLWSCIQVYGTLLGCSRVSFLINELHCIRSVHRLVYSPIIWRFRQLWRHFWYWYWNNTIINLYLIFFIFKVSICEICVFVSFVITVFWVTVV